MKYIMFKIKGGIGTRLVPIIFPDHFVHSMMADVIKRLIKVSFGKAVSSIEVESAGEIVMDVVATTGKSVSLEVEAKTDDIRVINSYGYMHGILR